MKVGTRSMRKTILFAVVFVIFFLIQAGDVRSANASTLVSTKTETADDTELQILKTKKQKKSRLDRVTNVKLTRYSTSAVKVSWNKTNKAKFYRIYVGEKQRGTYHLMGITQKQHALIKNLKKDKDYYFIVQACRKRKKSNTDGKLSQVVHIKMCEFTRKLVFAGDSICQGIGYYAVPKMTMPGTKKVVAYKGLNTITFRKYKTFNGKSGLTRVIEEKPNRLYIMLGINEIHYRKADVVLEDYRTLMKSIKTYSPSTEIVICAVSPVTLSQRNKRPGFKQIPAFNLKLKALANEIGAVYFDYTAFLKDENGCLKKGYAAGDGFHWTVPAYVKFAEIVSDFDRSLDE